MSTLPWSRTHTATGCVVAVLHVQGVLTSLHSKGTGVTPTDSICTAVTVGENFTQITFLLQAIPRSDLTIDHNP